MEHKIKNFLVASILFFYACGHQKEEQAITPATVNDNGNIVTLTEAQYKNAGIVIEPMGQHMLADVLKVNGVIDVPPQNMVSISMPLGGYLRTTKLLPGMPVKKGEVIAVLEDQQYIQLQQDYLTARARIDYARAEYKRQRILNQSKATSDKVYQLAQSEYNTLMVTINALAQKLRLININPSNVSINHITRSVQVYSPITGYVSRVLVNVGKYISPSDVLFELVNTSDIHLNLKVFEKDLAKLSIGQKLYAYTNSNPSKKHPCTILLIGRTLSNDRSAEVHCHFEDYDETLLPGMYMNADVDIKSYTGNALPQDAIVRYEGKNFVFKVNGKNKFEMVEVTPGHNENGFTEVSFTNKENYNMDSFVTKGAYTILMQLKNKEEE